MPKQPLDQAQNAEAKESSTAGTTLPVPPPVAGGPGSSIPGWSGGQPITLPVVFGRYRIERKLGQGGMGTVYLGTDTALERPVAIKIPTVHLDSIPNLRERFFREAKLAATLRHANLCPVYDFGQIQSIDYLVMAYIDGRPLSHYGRQGAKLPPRNVVTVIRCLALAMFEAHSKGVIHRDLKPSNIMIATNKQPVIMDFGLAKRAESSGGTLMTQSGAIMGTPEYMPPEQIDGDISRIGPRTDIYSLGVILYELLAGKRPFQGSMTELIVQIASQPPPSIRKVRADVDPLLEQICFKALAKSPEKRFSDMREFAAALAEWLGGRRPESVPVPEAETDSVVIELFDEMAKEVVKPHDAQISKADSMYWAESKPKDPSKTRRRTLDAKRRNREDLVWLRVVLWTAIPPLTVLLLFVIGYKTYSAISGSIERSQIEVALKAAKSSDPINVSIFDKKFFGQLRNHKDLSTKVGDILCEAHHRELAEDAWEKSDEGTRRNVRLRREEGPLELGNAWWELGKQEKGNFGLHCFWNASEVYSESGVTSEIARVRRAAVRLANSPSGTLSAKIKKAQDLINLDRELPTEFALRLNESFKASHRPWKVRIAMKNGAPDVVLEVNGIKSCNLSVDGRTLPLGNASNMSKNDFLLVFQKGTISIASWNEWLALPFKCDGKPHTLQFEFRDSGQAAECEVTFWESLNGDSYAERLAKLDK